MPLDILLIVAIMATLRTMVITRKFNDGNHNAHDGNGNAYHAAIMILRL